MKDISLLKKRLVGYSAMGAAMMACPKNADAQIVYTDIIPDYDFPYDTDTFKLDLNNDGIVDFLVKFKVHHPSTSEDCPSHFFSLVGLNGNKIFGDGNVINLAPGSLIGPISSYSSSGGWENQVKVMGYGCIYNSYYGGICDCETSGIVPAWNTYFGLELLKESKTYFGWVRLDVKLYGPILKDYAISSVDEQFIQAGDTVLCNESVISIYPADSVGICIGDSIELLSDTLSGFDTHWLNDNVIIVDWSTGTFYTGNSYMVTQPGVYSTLLYDSITNCGIHSKTVEVYQFMISSSTISQISDSLLCSVENALYQWYFDGIIIPGATNQIFIPTQSGSYQVEVTDSNGCTAISEPFGYIDVSIDSQTLNPSIDAFTSDQILHITLDAALVPSEIKLFDVAGCLLMKTNATQTYLDLNVGDLSEGIYLLLVEFENQKWVKKVMIE